MGIIITPQAEIERYFESPAMNQSLLKGLLGGMEKFLENKEEDEKTLYYQEKGHFIIGSAVDMLLTGDQSEFDNHYYVSKIEVKPSDVEMSITNMVWDMVLDHYSPVEVEAEGFDYGVLAQYPAYIDTAIVEENWYKGKPGEKRTAGLVERCMEYFQDLKLAHGKQVISVEQNFIITEIVNSLRNNLRTSKYFNRVAQADMSHTDFYYQLPIYFEHDHIACKALLDLVIVEKDEKTSEIISVEPIDLKTFGQSTVNFLSMGIKARRYDIQASWYTEAIFAWLGQLADDPDYDDVNDAPDIKPFKFIVESTAVIGKPLVYICSDELYEIGCNGRPEASTTVEGEFGDLKVLISKPIKGWAQLFDEYKYYESIEWKEDKDVYENDGVLTVDWNGVVK